MSIIKEAVDRAGKAGAVARAMGISRISVYEWIEKDRLPPDRVLALAELTSWEFTPHKLAPERYPNPTDGLPVPV
ncbi:YdaS family helix-turn-helix protein [Paraburkholderia sartisoli]|uniref:YdaS family helix-turn-helix protein n=1 Tax=Paraburkholderia sartisoli TaxID=83784 RepID=UPI000B87753E|nr:YdaS family helix-turn-helix protein [Paraburkholderia sartisoli]